MTQPTEIFFLTAREHARRPAVGVRPGAALRLVVGLLGREMAPPGVAGGGAGRPAGIVTERDIVRRATFAAPPEQPVRDLMSWPVRCIREDEHLFIAIARMRRLGHRHMPVIDGEGRLAGILDLHDAMGRAARDMVVMIDDLTRDDSDDGLREVKAAQVRVADTLFAANVAVGDIQATLSHVNNDIYARLLERNLAAMAGEGLGCPPAPFAMIIMGSGGRHENFLTPDQDYGFVIEDGASALDERADGWFAALAERLSHDLDAVGLRYCDGGVMATNPQWRKTLAGWKAQIDTWCRRARIDPLLDFDIFFDFRLGWGDARLAAALREHVTRRTAGNEAFLRELHATSRDHGTALAWFGRFATERADPAHRGKVNLKMHGTLPLVAAARLFALRDGVAETGTRERLAACHAAGVLNDAEHDDLDAARQTICRLLLGRQLVDFSAGAAVSSFIDPGALTPRRKRQLREALRAIERLRKRLAVEFGGEPI
ncbi:MAG: DUF294 nucleotidyltransferase-like domain-containing protein [Defluviicoccus sp.]|nr:DUF294 nucleotidyltransferase-like domain-containing protein [Defluviicoccus sp.]